MDAGCAPSGILSAHLADQVSDFVGDAGWSGPAATSHPSNRPREHVPKGSDRVIKGMARYRECARPVCNFEFPGGMLPLRTTPTGRGKGLGRVRTTYPSTSNP